jgi:hypothetical protein
MNILKREKIERETEREREREKEKKSKSGRWVVDKTVLGRMTRRRNEFAPQ